jgi:hypothetical protein
MKTNTNIIEYSLPYKRCSILLLCFISMFIGTIHSTNTIIDIGAIIEINEFRNCIFTKQKNTKCHVDINNYTFNLTNCHYDNNFWDFCDCCPKISLFGNKLKNAFCPHEGKLDLKSRYGNFTVKCGLLIGYKTNVN